MDRRKQKQAEDVKYVHQDWPAVYYGPDGKSQVFQSADEVPDDWRDHPSKVGKAEEDSASRTEFTADHITDDDEDVEWLMDQTNGATVEILKLILAENEVEHLASWPKMKLAKTVVAEDLMDSAREIIARQQGS